MPGPTTPKDTYNPLPQVQPGGGGGTPMSVRASPDDFGAQVGAEMKRGGEIGFQNAIAQQGMINETMMTQADADFATKVGALKGDYLSKTGMAAFNSFPQYQQEIRKTFEESRAGLPPAARRGFDIMAARSMANHIADGSTYAAGQLKTANREAYSSLANIQIQSLLDPTTAIDPQRSAFALDSVRFATQAQMDTDHPGLKTDPKTGAVNFDEGTPEGRQLKAEFEQRLDSNMSQAYLNRYDTLAKHDVFGAYESYQKDRGDMPKSAQVALDASFAPKIMRAHTQIATNNTMNFAANQHFEKLTQPGADTAITAVLKNEGGLSPDGHALYGIDKSHWPNEFKQAQEITRTQGEEAGQKYARDFYKREFWDKRGIGNLPPETRTIVMDGVVNHYTGFGDKLIDAAKNGATPQQLLQMRDAEYDRLAREKPEQYGQYLEGWKGRLENLQLSTEGKTTYAVNDRGGPLTLADYYRTHSQEVLERGDAYAESQMPGDLSLKHAVRESLNNYMSKTIANENAQHVLENKSVMRAIHGEFSNGKIPETEEDLRQIPGMDDLLDSIAVRDPKFYETIPTIIGKMAKRNDVSNSSNGYDTILRTLQPNDGVHPNAILSQDHLSRLLGRSDGTGISMRDYQDARHALDLDEKFKKFLSEKMQEVSKANGNIDGQGQKRAIQYFNDMMVAINTGKEQKIPISDMLNPENKNYIGNATASYIPTRAEQIRNAASSQKPFDYGAIPRGQQYVAPDGTIRMKQ